ncbi:hypothetical protein LXL04_009601 [Taraxacum kok-saghyz]
MKRRINGGLIESMSQLLTRLLSINQVSINFSFAVGFLDLPVIKPDLFRAPIRISISWDHKGVICVIKGDSGGEWSILYILYNDRRRKETQTQSPDSINPPAVAIYAGINNGGGKVNQVFTFFCFLPLRFGLIRSGTSVRLDTLRYFGSACFFTSAGSCETIKNQSLIPYY